MSLLVRGPSTFIFIHLFQWVSLGRTWHSQSQCRNQTLSLNKYNVLETPSCGSWLQCSGRWRELSRVYGRGIAVPQLPCELRAESSTDAAEAFAVWAADAFPPCSVVRRLAPCCGFPVYIWVSHFTSPSVFVSILSRLLEPWIVFFWVEGQSLSTRLFWSLLQPR